jgi:hypothetical protein
MARKPTGEGISTADAVRGPGARKPAPDTIRDILEGVPNVFKVDSVARVLIAHGSTGADITNVEALVELWAALEPAPDIQHEIDETLARLGEGIDREIAKMDELLSRLRRTRIAA